MTSRLLVPAAGVVAAAYIALHGYSAARLDVLRLLDSFVAVFAAAPEHPTLNSNGVLGGSYWLTEDGKSPSWLVRWNESAAQLSVSRMDDLGKWVPLWATRAARQFVAAASSESAAAEAHGNFQIRERMRWQCVRQRL